MKNKIRSEQELLELTDESLRAMDMPEGTLQRFKKAREKYLETRSQISESQNSQESSTQKNYGTEYFIAS